MSFPGLPSSSIELLESRIAPAGIITLDIDKSGYLLTGDALSNDLLITRDGALITLTPRNDTQIQDKVNGGTSTAPISFPIFSNRLDINMGGGADVLTLQDLTLLGDLRVDSGALASPATPDADVITISDLRVAGDLTLNAQSGTWTIDGQDFYVGGNASITSRVQAFDVNVASAFVGDDLTIDAFIAKASDRFEVRTDSFIVFNNLVVTPSVFADASGKSVLMIAQNVFNVGRSFQVINGQTGDASLGVGAAVVDISGKLSVENQSIDGDLNFGILAEDALRLHAGIGITSRSTGLTAVDIEADLVRIDSAVSAKFSKGDGSLAIVSDNLLIKGNVSFAAKGSGTLQVEGAGDVFGKISASLGNGAGEVTVKGRDAGQLFFNGLNVTATTKLPATAAGASITVEDVGVFGKTALRLGTGKDTVTINDSDFYGLTSISTGDGDDVVNLHTAGTYDASFAGLKVALGSGNDSLTLGLPAPAEGQVAPLLSIFKVAVFDGGSGSDSYPEGRNVIFRKGGDRLPIEFSPRVRNFEPQTT